MKRLSIQSLLLVSALFAPGMQAQDASAKVREIEQKVLLKQYQKAVHALVGSAREAEAGETGDNPELLDKRLQWIAMVDAQIETGGKTSAANQAEMTESAKTLNGLAWRMITAPDAEARHPEVAVKLASIAIELVGENEELKSKVLGTKARALFLLGKQGEAIAEQEKAVAAATVVEEKAGFEATLAAYRSNELPKISWPADERVTTNDSGDAVPSSGVFYITEKLKRIVIPLVDFENTTLEEAVEFLRKQSIELDKMELDPARKGVNFVVRGPAATSAPASSGDLPITIAEAETVRIKSLHLRNVPLAVVLKYICDATRFRYKVDDFAVSLVFRDAPEDLFTRSFRVPTDFASMLDSGSETDAVTARPPMLDLLKSAGIDFPEGSSVTYTSSGVLMVTNTPSELDKIEMLIMTMSDSGARTGGETHVPPGPVPADPVPAESGAQ